MKQAVIQSAEQAARPLDVGGFHITVLVSTDQTEGYELFRITGPEGTGPGPRITTPGTSPFSCSAAQCTAAWMT
jgi:hypothetical protein